MKTARSIGKSRNARLNQTAKHVRELDALMAERAGTPHDTPILDPDFWNTGRTLVAQISQCFHEANAHNNDLADEGSGFDNDEYQVANR
jgi:hypothetical protein